MIDEASHPTAGNGSTASELVFRDETFVKTSDWLRLCAHLDYEPFDVYQASRIPAENVNPSKLVLIEGYLDQEKITQADENIAGGAQSISGCDEHVELNKPCSDNLGQSHSGSDSGGTDSATSQELGIPEIQNHVDNGKETLCPDFTVG